MLLSRFWYLVLAIALGTTIGGLFLAQAVFNRASRSSMEQALWADTQVVKWFINDDARRRSSLLLKVCLDDTIRKELHKASSKDDAVATDVRERTRTALRKLVDEMPEEHKFTSLFAIDQLGRVIGQVGFDQASGIENFDMGGYAIVADALHGWVRDDAWVLDDRIYLVVARPVEVDTAQMPAGAVVGLRIVDTSYARQISKRSGAAVGFFAGGTVKAKAAPEGTDPTQLDTIVGDIKNLDSNEEYNTKGTSRPTILMGDIGVLYAKIPGEAWDLGAGYVVGRSATVVKSPVDLLQIAQSEDKKQLPWWLVGIVVVLTAAAGVVFSVYEHTRPVRLLEAEAKRFAKGEIDILTVSKFRGLFRKIASDLNDGTEKVAAKGGVPRKAADLESVLGPIPAKPEMSAFSFPSDDEPGPDRPSGPRTPPKDIKLPVQLPSPNGGASSSASHPKPKPPKMQLPSPDPGSVQRADPLARASVPIDRTSMQQAPSDGATEPKSPSDELVEWQRVFDDFVQTKTQCGEPTSKLTFEKFQTTLKKNRDQVMEKTGCTSVKFTVYVKEGRAALKATPIR